jgi:NAD(P)-dependent dehydrogenase (short-subunit alcohol dehydrogenase family)
VEGLPCNYNIECSICKDGSVKSYSAICSGGDEARRTITTAMSITEDQFFSAVPLQGRVGTGEELAEMVVFLASDRTSYINCHNHFVSGGWGELA